jgi:hypothetical protein
VSHHVNPASVDAGDHQPERSLIVTGAIELQLDTLCERIARRVAQLLAVEPARCESCGAQLPENAPCQDPGCTAGGTR